MRVIGLENIIIATNYANTRKYTQIEAKVTIFLHSFTCTFGTQLAPTGTQLAPREDIFAKLLILLSNFGAGDRT